MKVEIIIGRITSVTDESIGVEFTNVQGFLEEKEYQRADNGPVFNESFRKRYLNRDNLRICLGDGKVTRVDALSPRQ